MELIHSSSSAEQSHAEKAAIDWLADKWNMHLEHRQLLLGSTKVEIDGCSISESTFVEVYAGVGKIKPAQIRKVLADAFKLVAIEKSGEYGHNCKKHLCFIDQTTLNCFLGNHWYASALKLFGVNLELVELPVAMIQSVREAKDRQGAAFRTRN